MRVFGLRSLRLVLAGLIVAVAGAGVGIAVAGRDDASAPEVSCPGANGRSRELRRCLEDVFAFVETPIGAGSGVLLTDGHIVTNAHVVDPYERVDVTFPGGERHEDVEVLGVDAFADIALLAPIDTDRRGLTIAPNPDLDADDEPEVLLVGFPGGVEGDDPRVTLSSGILSRIREVDDFDATYLQTDAAIAGGQSGGALIDGDGRLLGISGLGFAEEFALALSSDDVIDAVERIRSGAGDARRTIPPSGSGGADPVGVDLALPDMSAAAIIPSAEDDRTVRVHVQADRPVSVDVSSFFGDPIGLNASARQLIEDIFGDAEDLAFPLDDIPDLVEVEPGVYEFEAPADEDVLVVMRFLDRQPGSLTFDADTPFVVHTDLRQHDPLAVGDDISGVVDAFTWEDIYEVELTSGQEIEITLRSPSSDPYYILLGPGEEYSGDLEPTADDGAGGLYDLDAQDTHEIDETGTYRIVVGTYDGIVAGYRLSVKTARP